jgi:hypothetical protein
MDQELVQYLEERFTRQEQGFHALLDDRFGRQEQRFQALLHERFEEVKRHTGVLVEGLRHEVQLLAEGFATFVEVRYAEDQANIAQQFQETRALIHLSYDQLRQRVENLERKSQN